MARKSLGKIKGGPNKDKEVFAEDRGEYITMEMGGTQVAVITPGSGSTPESVFASLQPKE
jgi:hypothetical protein